MTYCLDTNTCIYYLNNSVPNVCKRLDEIPFRDVKIPSMVAAELLYGAEKSAKREYNYKIASTFLSLYEIIDFDENAAKLYAVFRARLERTGRGIGSNDLIIAATALSHESTLVTHSIGEFSRITELRLEDWVI